MCEVLARLDDDPAIETLRQEAKVLMRALGPLRDLHVLRALLDALVEHPLPVALARVLSRDVARARVRGRRALQMFDDAAFVLHAQRVDQKVARLGDDHPAIVHIAWERLVACIPFVDEARLHAQDGERLHAVRIALKRFRYVVESFLPTTHASIGPLLKARQDLLGEIHDLDVAHARMLAPDVMIPQATKRRALARFRSQRRTRVRAFLRLGDDVLTPFFTALPSGEALFSCAVARVAATIDFALRNKRAGARRARHAELLTDVFVRENLLPIGIRNASLTTLAARAVGRMRIDRTGEGTRTLLCFTPMKPFDIRFFDEFARLVDVARQDEPHGKSRTDTLQSAIVWLVGRLDASSSPFSIRAARIEGRTLVIVTTAPTRVLRARERRAFTRATGLTLNFVRILSTAAPSV